MRRRRAVKSGLSDCLPPAGTPDGTLHVLVGRGGTRTVFLWRNSYWSTPGTGWGTSTTAMQTLGWRYGEPARPAGDGDAR